MRICHLYSELMNVNGSRGNLDCLEARAAWRGIPCEVESIPALGYDGGFEGFDLIYIGAAHSSPSPALLGDIRRLGPELRARAENGGVTLAICEGFELLAESVTLPDGSSLPAGGVLPMTVSYAAQRLTGNYSFDCGGGIGPVAAFRNHAGRVSLSPGLSPLGLLPDGTGEGARYKNVFGCYGHGPLLPKNPRLADAILAFALQAELAPLDDALENSAHDYMMRKLK